MTATGGKHETTKKILGCVKYKTHQWHIRSDLKVTAISRGLQQGCTKFCFLRERDYRVKIVHQAKKNWPLRKSHLEQIM
jgi:hypothetical protein